jgi:hypothetical protein
VDFRGSIPAAFIAMIGRDQRYSGAGFGGDLLVDALRRIARAADSLEIAGALLDVLDCGDLHRTARRQALYESYGFQPLPSMPARLFLPLSATRELIQALCQQCEQGAIGHHGLDGDADPLAGRS